MTKIDPAILNALDDLLPLAGFPTLRDDVADRLAPLIADVNLAELTAALAERDAARAEVARLRAAVDDVLDRWRNGDLNQLDQPGLDDALTAALAATEDQA